ncbi:MAG: VPDSG-CTERM sorting domain-containing protein [Candidatus Udaeobacter sp.]
MKINIIPTRKLALLCTAIAGALFTFSQSANALALQSGDSHELGLANSDRSNYANHLIAMLNDFNRTPQAALAERVNNGDAGGVVRKVMTIRQPATPIIGKVPPGGTAVPDGGTTAILLGAALSALGIARRFLLS